jgi:hypothetical protein
VHEADEPNAVVDFLDAELLAGQHDGDVDPLAVQAEATAGCDDDVTVVEGIGQFGQADIGARRGSVELGKSAGDVCSAGDEFEGAQPSCVIIDIGNDHELVGACFLNERIDARTNRIG